MQCELTGDELTLWLELQELTIVFRPLLHTDVPRVTSGWTINDN